MSGRVDNTTILGAGVSTEDDKRKSECFTRRARANQEAESLQCQIKSDGSWTGADRSFRFSPGGVLTHHNYTTLGSELGDFAASNLRSGQQYAGGPSPVGLSNALRQGPNVRTLTVNGEGWSLESAKGNTIVLASATAKASKCVPTEFSFTGTPGYSDCGLRYTVDGNHQIVVWTQESLRESLGELAKELGFPEKLHGGPTKKLMEKALKDHSRKAQPASTKTHRWGRLNATMAGWRSIPPDFPLSNNP